MEEKLKLLGVGAECLCNEMLKKMRTVPKSILESEKTLIYCLSFDCPRHGRVTFDNRSLPSNGPTYQTVPWAEYGVSKARVRDSEEERNRKRHPDRIRI